MVVYHHPAWLARLYSGLASLAGRCVGLYDIGVPPTSQPPCSSATQGADYNGPPGSIRPSPLALIKQIITCLCVILAPRVEYYTTPRHNRSYCQSLNSYTSRYPVLNNEQSRCARHPVLKLTNHWILSYYFSVHYPCATLPGNGSSRQVIASGNSYFHKDIFLQKIACRKQSHISFVKNVEKSSDSFSAYRVDAHVREPQIN